MPVWRYALTGLVFDWVLYVMWSVIPLQAHELGAAPHELGLLQAVSSVVYVLMSVAMGVVADRMPRPLLVRLGCVLMIACCLLVPRAGSLGALFLVIPLVGLAPTLLWPAVQADLAADARVLERNLGTFNILWSIGKAAGFLTGPALKGELGVTGALLAAAGGSALVVLFYPLARPPRVGASREERFDPHLRGTFLRLSWIMNFVCFGVGATLGNQYIKFCKAHAIGLPLGRGDPTEAFFGVFLFSVFMSQTLTFVAIRLWRGWTYRRAPLYAAQLLMAAACGATAFATQPPLLLALAPLIGVGLGFGYAASLYYSLHTPEAHGKFSGLHEAILGSGNFLLPLAAGSLASGFGDLRWPYWLCAGVSLLAIALEETVYRARNRICGESV